MKRTVPVTITIPLGWNPFNMTTRWFRVAMNKAATN